MLPTANGRYGLSIVETKFAGSMFGWYPDAVAFEVGAEAVDGRGFEADGDAVDDAPDEVHAAPARQAVTKTAARLFVNMSSSFESGRGSSRRHDARAILRGR